MLSLTWAQVDFKAGTVRLEVVTTKNGDGRGFPFTPELRSLLQAQRALTDRVQRDLGAVVRPVSVGAGRGSSASERRGRGPASGSSMICAGPRCGRWCRPGSPSGSP